MHTKAGGNMWKARLDCPSVARGGTLHGSVQKEKENKNRCKQTLKKSMDQTKRIFTTERTTLYRRKKEEW